MNASYDLFVDLFSQAPRDAVPLGLLRGYQPDLDCVYLLETGTPLRSQPLDPRLEFREVFRRVREFVGNRLQHNVIPNPMLQYPHGVPTGLNEMPDGWELVFSSHNAPGQWKFYPLALSWQLGAHYVFPYQEILQGTMTSQRYTILFPLGHVFLYQLPLSRVSQHLVFIRTAPLNLQPNTPYTLEIYYIYDPLPNFAPTGFAYPTGSAAGGSVDHAPQSWYDDEAYVEAYLDFGSDQSVSLGRVKHRSCSRQTPFARSLITPPIQPPEYIEIIPGIRHRVFQRDMVRRMVISTNIVWDESMSSPRLRLAFSNTPGLGLLAVVMYPTSRVEMFRWDTSDNRSSYDGPFPAYSFGSRPGWSSIYRCETGSRSSTLLGLRRVMGLEVPSVWYAGSDKRRAGTGYTTTFMSSVPSERGDHIPSSEFTPGGLRICFGRILCFPPTQSSLSASVASYEPVDPDFSLPSRVPTIPFQGSYSTQLREFYRTHSGVVSRQWRLCDTNEYANGLSLLSDDIPVVTNKTYRLNVKAWFFTDQSYPLTAQQAASQVDGYPYFVYTDPTSMDTSNIRFVVFGFDSNDQLVEIGYMSRIAPGSSDVVNGTPFVRFTNGNVVKARVGVQFLQPVVHPGDIGALGNASTPHVLLHDPRAALDLMEISLAKYWPDNRSIDADCSVISEAVADFVVRDWTGISQSDYRTGNEDVGKFGYFLVSPQSSAPSSGPYAWNLQNDSLVFVAFKIRFLQPQGHTSRVTFTLRFSGRAERTITTSTLLRSQSSGWTTVIHVFPNYLTLPAGDYSVTFSARFENANSMSVGYMNFALAPDPESTGEEERLVSIGVRLTPRLEQVQRFPRVVAPARVSRSHWGLRVQPGIAYLRYVVPPNEVSHSPIIRAGFQPGDDLTLVYVVPEASRTVTERPGQGSLRTEEVMALSGVFRLSEPTYPGAPITVRFDGGGSLTGSVGSGHIHMTDIGREIHIRHPDYAAYTGPAVVEYVTMSGHYIYTGCVYENFQSGDAPVPAVFNLSPYATEGGFSSAPFVAQIIGTFPFAVYRAYPHRNFIGYYVYLLPFMAIPTAQFNQGVRRGTVLPVPHGSYLRHALGYFSADDSPNRLYHEVRNSSGQIVQSGSLACIVLAWCFTAYPFGVGYIDLLDVRRRGGGLSPSSVPDDASRYWDTQSWDGGKSPGAGVAVVRLPRSILEPAPDRDAFTHEQVMDAIRRYLPAGIDYEVEYVD